MPRRTTNRKKQIPNVGNRVNSTQDFSEPILGFNTELANDNLPRSKWRLSQDARMNTVGDYTTKQGADVFSVPIGEAVFSSELSTAGAGTFDISEINGIAQRVTGLTGDPISKIRINLNRLTDSIGVVGVKIYDDDGGTPDLLQASSAADPVLVTTTPTYIDIHFIEAPEVTGTAYVALLLQDGATGDFQVTTTTNSSDAFTSSDSGQSWAAAAFSMNYEVFTATQGPIKGMIRVQRPSGTRHTFIAHGDTVYEVNEVTGATTAIDTGLDVTAEVYRFEFVKDTLYYVNGRQLPRKYDFTTASEVTAANSAASNLIDHQGVMVYTSSTDPSAHFTTEFLLYDEFDINDGAVIFYADGPEQADPSTAYASLSNLIVFNRNNKYVLYGEESANYQILPAQGRKGTFSQESVAVHTNYAYFASDDGIYRTSSGEDELISQAITNEYIALLDKNNIVLEVHDRRLYVFYTPNGSSENNRCFVYRLDYGFWESVDTRAHVAASHSEYDGEDLFLIGSNRLGAIYYNERSTNSYHNLGAPLEFELATGFDHFGAPHLLKEVRDWLPRFKSLGSGYTVQAGYSTNKVDAPIFEDVEIKSTAPTWDSGFLWDSGLQWDGGEEFVSPRLWVPGDYKYVKLIYKHHAAYEPVEFQGHGTTVNIQRLK